MTEEVRSGELSLSGRAPEILTSLDGNILRGRLAMRTSKSLKIFLMLAIMSLIVLATDIFLKHIRHQAEYRTLSSFLHIGMSANEVRARHPDVVYGECNIRSHLSWKMETSYSFEEHDLDWGIKRGWLAVCTNAKTDKVVGWNDVEIWTLDF